MVLPLPAEMTGKANSQPCKEEDDRVLGTTTISRWGYSSSKAIDEFRRELRQVLGLSRRLQEAEAKR